ncbi:ATP-binding cassette domain-containing protein [Candidatus Berkiella aquae]|uniref:ABC transporter ATP-binding protein n=1 Tax=Candidatus Berkiella aquae TaxID=295108 RepID=A0A0Q9YMC5_9GAMM|nr:ABC transporter ATP-binding protein [Candidatus Berkiella aquae]MCS5710045.1 ABC transporter ATP-binding protein [Candidatus Berkiella aquae]
MKGLQLNHLAFSMRGHTLFANLNARFALGHIVALAGPNGCGKSTLLRLLAGLNQPTQGEIAFNGSSLRFSEIGFLPNIPSLYPHLTVQENLIWLCRLRKVPHYAKLIQALFEQHQLNELKNKLFRQLSDGQKKRVHLLSSALHQPKLFILDEPCSLLDPKQRQALWTLLKEWRQPNRLIFFSTHHVTEVTSFCDEIVFLHQGQFHFEKQSIISKVTCL